MNCSLRLVVVAMGPAVVARAGFPEGFRSLHRIFAVSSASCWLQSCRNSCSVAARCSSISTEFGAAGVGQGHQLGAAVVGVRPADAPARVPQVRRCAGSGRERSRPAVRPGAWHGIPPPPRTAGRPAARLRCFQPARVGERHAPDRALEIEDLVDEFGRGVWLNCHDDCPLLLALGNYSRKWLLWETKHVGTCAAGPLNEQARTDS